MQLLAMADARMVNIITEAHLLGFVKGGMAETYQDKTRAVAGGYSIVHDVWGDFVKYNRYIMTPMTGSFSGGGERVIGKSMQLAVSIEPIWDGGRMAYFDVPKEMVPKLGYPKRTDRQDDAIGYVDLPPSGLVRINYKEIPRDLGGMQTGRTRPTDRQSEIPTFKDLDLDLHALNPPATNLASIESAVKKAKGAGAPSAFFDPSTAPADVPSPRRGPGGFQMH